MLIAIIAIIVVSFILLKKFERRNAQAFLEMKIGALNCESRNRNTFNAMDLSKKVVEEQHLSKVHLKLGSFLENHYNPHENIVQLGIEVAASKSNMSLLTALHELMHAYQHNHEKMVFQLIHKAIIVLRAIQYYSLFLIGLAGIVTMFIGGNLFYAFSILLPLFLKSIERILTLYVEIDAWQKVKRLPIVKEILQTNEEVQEARKVAHVALGSYIISCIHAFLVVSAVAVIFYSVNLITL